MKIRAQPKKVKGKQRWYLVNSYRNDAGESRTKWLVYLGDPPSSRLKKFISRANKHPALEFFFPYLIESIKKYAIKLRKKRQWQRNQRIPRLKRRRDLYAAHKAGLPFLRRSDPFAKISHRIWNLGQAYERLKADPNYGPVENWPEDQKEMLRLKLKPFLEFCSMVKAELSGEKGFVATQSTTSLGNKLENKADIIEKKLKFLSEREAAIVRYRFGLDDGEKKSLAETGRKYGVTRERIRQIEKHALDKLRSG